MIHIVASLSIHNDIIVHKQVVFCKDEKDWKGYGIGNVNDSTMSIIENFSNCILVLNDMNEKLNKAISLYFIKWLTLKYVNDSNVS